MAALTDPLRIDIQCWCPDEEDDARRRHAAAAAAVAVAGGTVLDRTLRHIAGLSLLRADIPAAAIGPLAQTNLIRRLDILPRPDLGRHESVALPLSGLPAVLPPREDAPIVAVLDSGIRSARPLLAPAVVAVEAEGLPEPADANGHGTFVASLALYGSLEPLLLDNRPLQPVARLVSVRVLDDDGNFPDEVLWESALLTALETAADLGARVVNLSIGDERAPYASERPTPLGVAIDDFVRRRGAVVVVSAGNYRPAAYAASQHLAASYAHTLLEDPAAGLLDPASSALSLTVGALAADDGQGFRAPKENIDRVPLGRHGLPSPWTRRGHAPRRRRRRTWAGRPADRPVRHKRRRAASRARRPVSPRPDARPDRERRARPSPSVRGPARAVVPAAAHRRQMRAGTERLGGYGRPQAQRAARSSDHRAVLLAESAIPFDRVHLYRVPVPSTFFDGRGWRRLTVALAYDPPVRGTRLDYMSSNMHVNVYRGLKADQVASAYIAEENAAHAAQPNDTNDEAAAPPIGPRTIRPFLVPDMHPSEQRRSRGANQYATKLFKQRLAPEKGLEFVVAVHNKQNWPVEDSEQTYTLAVAVERDERSRELYADVRSLIELETAVEIELDAEVEIRGG